MHLAQHYAEVLLSVHAELITSGVSSGDDALLKGLHAPIDAINECVQRVGLSFAILALLTDHFRAFEKARTSLAKPSDYLRTPQHVPLIDSTLFRSLVVTILRRLSLSDALNKFMVSIDRRRSTVYEAILTHTLFQISLGMIKRAATSAGPSTLPSPPRAVPKLGYEYESLRDLSVVEGDKLREDLLSLRLLIFQTRDEVARKEMQAIVEETLPAREVAQLML